MAWSYESLLPQVAPATPAPKKKVNPPSSSWSYESLLPQPSVPQLVPGEVEENLNAFERDIDRMNVENKLGLHYPGPGPQPYRPPDALTTYPFGLERKLVSPETAKNFNPNWQGQLPPPAPEDTQRQRLGEAEHALRSRFPNWDSLPEKDRTRAAENYFNQYYAPGLPEYGTGATEALRNDFIDNVVAYNFRPERSQGIDWLAAGYQGASQGVGMNLDSGVAVNQYVGDIISGKHSTGPITHDPMAAWDNPNLTYVPKGEIAQPELGAQMARDYQQYVGDPAQRAVDRGFTAIASASLGPEIGSRILEPSREELIDPHHAASVQAIQTIVEQTPLWIASGINPTVGFTMMVGQFGVGSAGSEIKKWAIMLPALNEQIDKKNVERRQQGLEPLPHITESDGDLQSVMRGVNQWGQEYSEFIGARAAAGLGNMGNVVLKGVERAAGANIGTRVGAGVGMEYVEEEVGNLADRAIDSFIEYQHPEIKMPSRGPLGKEAINTGEVITKATLPMVLGMSGVNVSQQLSNSSALEQMAEQARTNGDTDLETSARRDANIIRKGIVGKIVEPKAVQSLLVESQRRYNNLAQLNTTTRGNETSRENQKKLADRIELITRQPVTTPVATPPAVSKAKQAPKTPVNAPAPPIAPAVIPGLSGEESLRLAGLPLEELKDKLAITPKGQLRDGLEAIIRAKEARLIPTPAPTPTPAPNAPLAAPEAPAVRAGQPIAWTNSPLGAIAAQTPVVAPNVMPVQEVPSDKTGQGGIPSVVGERKAHGGTISKYGNRPAQTPANRVVETSSQVQVTGKNSTAYTPNNEPIEVTYQLREADDLTTSHDENGSINQNYPSELQPRDRSRQANLLQIESMSQNLNPELMAESPQIQNGAPIIGPDGVVESGNGRIIALRKAYQGGMADGYRQWLISNAAQFGLSADDITRMKNPVLVRTRVTDVDRAEFTRQANRNDMIDMGPAEKARVDAARMTPELLAMLNPDESGSLLAATNRGFIRGFLDMIGPQESAGLVTANGVASKSLVDRMKSAIFERAYQDDGLLELMSEETDSGIQNIMNGLIAAAPKFTLIEEGSQFNFVRQIVDAAVFIRDVRNEGLTVNQALSQGEFFQPKAKLMEDIARAFDEYKRSPNKIVLFLKTIGQFALDNQGTNMTTFPGMQGEVRIDSPSEIIKSAKAAVAEEYKSKKKPTDETRYSMKPEAPGPDWLVSEETGPNKFEDQKAIDEQAAEVLAAESPSNAFLTEEDSKKQRDKFFLYSESKPGTFTGLKAGNIVKNILPVLRKIAPNVWSRLNIVQTIDELPEKVRNDAREAQAEGGLVEAVYDIFTDKIFVVADNISSVDHLWRVAFKHEPGHAAFYNMMDAQGRRQLTGLIWRDWQLDRDGLPGVISIAEHYGIDVTEIRGQQQASEEWLSFLAEADQLQAHKGLRAIWDRFVSLVRAGLRRIMPNLTLKATEIRDYMRQVSEWKRQSPAGEQGVDFTNPDIRMSSTYRGSHRPNEDGPPAYNLLKGNLIPNDIYDHPKWYSGDISRDGKVVQETMAVLKKVRGNPNSKITVYRSGPVRELNPGDWVTISKTYADSHGDGRWESHSFEVAAKDIRWAMDDLSEWGFYPANEQPLFSQKPADTALPGQMAIPGFGVKNVVPEQKVERPNPGNLPLDIEKGPKPTDLEVQREQERLAGVNPAQPEPVMGYGPTQKTLFSKAPVEQVRNLVPLHNLTAANLWHAIKMGGAIPVPSVAIARTDVGEFSNFGEITLIGTRDMVDPQVNKSAKVFNTDVYSPRYPTIQTDLAESDWKKLLAELNPIKTQYPNLGSSYRATTSSIFDEVPNRGVQYALENSPLVWLKYAVETNQVPKGFEKLDGYAAEEPLRKFRNDPKYQEWLTNWIDSLGLNPKERIFDGFNYNGNRKYKAHTLENVVNILKRKLKDGEGFNYGVPSIRAKTAKKYNTISGIQADRNNIIDTEKMKEVKELTEAEFMRLFEKYGQRRSGGPSLDGFSDDFKAMIDGDMSYLREQYPDGDPFPEMRDFLGKLKVLPTEYFEAKIQRAVGLQEFAAAVVPSNTDDKLIDALKSLGLNVVKYDRDVKGSRQAAINQATANERNRDIRFSMKPKGPDPISLLIDSELAENEVYANLTANENYAQLTPRTKPSLKNIARGIWDNKSIPDNIKHALDLLLTQPGMMFKRHPTAYRVFSAAMNHQDMKFEFIDRILGVDRTKDKVTSLIDDIVVLNKRGNEKSKALFTKVTIEADMNLIPPREAVKLIQHDPLALAAWQSFRQIVARDFELRIEDTEKKIATLEKLGRPLPNVNITDSNGKTITVDLRAALDNMKALKGTYFPRIRSGTQWALFADKKGESQIKEQYDLRTTASANADKYKGQGYTTKIEKINRLPDTTWTNANTVNLQQIINAALSKESGKKGNTWTNLGMTARWAKSSDGKTDLTVSGSYSDAIVDTMKKMGGRWYQAEGQPLKSWHFVGVNPATFESELQDALSKVVNSGNRHLEMLDEVAKSLAVSVAEMIQARGSRASMIHRLPYTGKQVYTGYITDPLEAIVQHVLRTAGGVAKQRMAQDYFNIMTGTDINREDFENDKDYQAAVDKRKFDAEKDPAMYSAVQHFIAEQLRNSDVWDRVFGTVKSLAIIKYLSIRPAGPVINLTAMVTSVPAMMMKHGVSVAGVAKNLTRGTNIAIQHWTGGELTHEYRWLFNEIDGRGWSNSQVQHEAIDVLQGRVGGAYKKTITGTMYAFAKTEQFNRTVTIASSYFALRENGIEDWEAALAEAKEISDDAHGTYGKVNRPSWAMPANATHWYSKIAYHIGQSYAVFMTWNMNYVGQFADAVTGRYSGKRFSRAQRAKAAIWLGLSGTLLFGAEAGLMVQMGLILARGALGLAHAAGVGPDDDDLMEQFYEWLEKETNKYVANYARYGLLGMTEHGINLRGSIQNLPPSWVRKSPGWDKSDPFDISVWDLFGAPGNMIKDMYDGAMLISEGKVWKGTEKLTPLGIANVMRALREYREGATTGGNLPIWYVDDDGSIKQVKGDMIDAILRVFSFNPSRTSKIRDVEISRKNVQAVMAKERTDINSMIRSEYAEYLAGIKPGQGALAPVFFDTDGLKRIKARIEEYNLTAKRLNDKYGKDFVNLRKMDISAQMKEVRNPSSSIRKQAANIRYQQGGGTQGMPIAPYTPEQKPFTYESLLGIPPSNQGGQP